MLPLRKETLHKSLKFAFAIVTSTLNWTTSPEEKTVSHVSRKTHLKIKQKPRVELYTTEKQMRPKEKMIIGDKTK